MGEPRPAAGVEPGLLAAGLAMALLLMAFGALATLGGALLLRLLSGEEVRELARLAAQHDPTDYELEYGELRRPMFASPDENGTAVNAAEGAGGEQARIHSVEALHRLGRF